MGTADYAPQEIDDALTALIAYAGSAYAAIKYLQSVGKRAPSMTTLIQWSRTTHWERYEQLRDQFSQQAENTLANNYLDAARAATEGAMLATQKAVERLNAGLDLDPARTAANLAKVSQSSVDKRLGLQGRPSSITESRTPEQVMAGLIARYPTLFGLTEEPKELEEGEEAAHDD